MTSPHSDKPDDSTPAEIFDAAQPVAEVALDNANASWLSRALLRPLFAACLLLAGYFLLPFNHHSDWTITGSIVGAMLLALFCAWEVRAFLHSTYPLAAALEMLVALVTLYVITFSAAYFLLSDYAPASFDEHLTRMDALYFCVTVLTTTGFGDINAVTAAARVVVTFQMASNLVLLGLGFRFFTMAVTARVRANERTR